MIGQPQRPAGPLPQARLNGAVWEPSAVSCQYAYTLDHPMSPTTYRYRTMPSRKACTWCDRLEPPEASGG